MKHIIMFLIVLSANFFKHMELVIVKLIPTCWKSNWSVPMNFEMDIVKVDLTFLRDAF